MKKKIIGTIVVIAIAALAAFNMNMNTENNELSALTMDNVEALASNEGYGPCYVHYAQFDRPCLPKNIGGYCPCGY